jgi:hypothetical protein
VDIRFGSWNVKKLYRTDSLMAIMNEIPKYKLELVGPREDRWDIGGTEKTTEYIFFYRKGIRFMN